MDIKRLILIFLGWRLLLFIFLFLGMKVLPLQKNFLGGGLANYLEEPYFWAWANFDGEHYLNIAQNGYGYNEQAFFPVYPMLIRVGGEWLGGTLRDFNLAGLLISNLSFLLALWGVFELLRIDFSRHISLLSTIMILVFPTAFYFGSVYTESLFLAEVIWSFYFARKGNWFMSSLLAGVCTATRFTGILLFPALFLEFLEREKRLNLKGLNLLLIPIGLLSFMYYLNLKEGDPIKFIRVLPAFGEQRQASPVILPRVFYRYIFKILPNIDYSFFPVVFTTYLEFFVAVVFLIFSIIAFFKLRLSYSVFAFGSYLVPTLTGSFSSLPRYVLVAFPLFALFALVLKKKTKLVKIFIILALSLLQALATMLFTRGYWVS